MGSSSYETIWQGSRAMPAGNEADAFHSRRHGCCDAMGAVLDDDALTRICAELLGGVKKQIRCWFSIRDHLGREDVFQFKMVREPCHAERETDAR